MFCNPPTLSLPHEGGGDDRRRCGKRGFERTQVWIFDLDNTLYPAECNLFAQVDQSMGEFIARFLGVPFAYARHLQKTYYRQFGTTLTGLMQVHRIDPKAFLDYVHDIDLSVVDEHPELAAAIDRLPGRKLIFTNGSRAHAERVAGKLGVLHCFEDIFDICDADYVPKAHRRLLRPLLPRARGRRGRLRHVRGHAAQPGGPARAGHDDRAGALERPLRPSRAAEDPRLGRAARARAPHDA